MARAFALISMLALFSPASAATPFIGVDANYSLAMERDGQKWRRSGKEGDLFKGMAACGIEGFRVRLWTKGDGPNGKDYATEVVKRALAAGLDPYLVIFLSEDWADLMKQPAPAPWKDLAIPQRAEAVRKYSREIVAHFRKVGLESHLYEIGNEIDYGICGVYPGKGTKKTPASLSKKCWPQAAELIRASQAGVLEADPDAKFMLHIAHWWDVKFCVAFFKFMLDHGVRVDYAGLSYFPSSNIGGSLEMEQFGRVARELSGAIDRPIIVPEVAYPSTRDFTGQFSRWKKETPGYPLSPDGQRRWISDFLDYCASRPEIAAITIWSPEWCGEGMWKAFALFDPQGEAKAAWTAFAKPRDKRSAPRTPAFFEILDGRLFAVPVAEARKRALPILDEKLAKFGQVNLDYIKDITATPLAVESYDVTLRATISGNLDLALRPDAKPLPDWKAAIQALDPKTRHLVVFARDETDPLATEILAAAGKLGLAASIHPTDGKKPLKFGLGRDGQGDAMY
jgi:arabinogalactan endo-1,4-beta-galactosidase